MLLPCAVVELVWQDASGSTSATTVFARSSATVSEIEASASALASSLAPLTGAVLIKQRIKYVNRPETRPEPDDNTSIKRTGVFFFETGEDTPAALIVVPAIKDSVIMTTGVGAGVIIDIANSEVEEFGETVIDGLVTNVFSDDVLSLFTAYLQSRI